MNGTRAAIAAMTLLAVMSVTACGGADVRTETSTTTTGQELLDLKKAYDAGVITEKEYERKREEILERD